MKIKVGVFFGGNSVEHEISIISAMQAITAIDKTIYEVVPVYITRNNEFYCGEQIGKVESYGNIGQLIQSSKRVIPVKGNSQMELYQYPARLFSSKAYQQIDIAFPIAHGTNVEDGVLQGFLQYFNIPVVGCDVLSSAIGMDKYVMKMVLADSNIPVLSSLRFHVGQFEADEVKAVLSIEEKFAYPVIVKPINLGSSVGIKIARNKEELMEALNYAFEFSKDILVEPAISHLREINCSVLGDMEEAIASECEEPFNTDEILSYKDKYLSTNSSKGMASVKRKLPAGISEELKLQIQDLAVKTFKALRCHGVIRIDFMINQDDGIVYVNEVNTIPGSLAFYLWQASGITYTALLTRLIQLSLKKKRENEALSFEYSTNILEGFSFGGSKHGKL